MLDAGDVDAGLPDAGLDDAGADDAGVDGGPDGSLEFGMPCVDDGDCAASGAGAVCKHQTSSGNATYAGGYCTRPCDRTDGNSCGPEGFCASFRSNGEDDAICLDRCGAGLGTCRSPGYLCYSNTSLSVCWIDPLPQVHAAPPAGLIGAGCGTDPNCQAAGAYPDGLCVPEATSAGPTGFAGGYCSADCSNDVTLCGSGAICGTLARTFALCLDLCAAGNAGQSDCRAGYVCKSYELDDGGVSDGGYCWPNCNARACPTGQTCDAATGYCQ